MKLLLSFILLWSRSGASPLGINGRIANGFSALFDEFPYMVLIETETVKNICGGSLISSRWVLTAAHCFDSAGDGYIIHVYLGITTTNDAAIGYALWSSDAVRSHRLYNPETLENDIALIQIPNTAPCNKIRPVPLPALSSSRPKTYVGEVGIACGWGGKGDRGGPSDHLQCGRMRIASNQICALFKTWRVDGEICIDPSDDFVSSCVGDSGGPFVLESTGELVAIISHGFGKSCELGNPLFYTRITTHLQWIKSKTGIFY